MSVRKRFGQHFLEPSWADKVVDAIGPARDETFLEIGPGRGALTRPLAARAGRVIAVEIDRDLAARLVASGIPNLEVVTADVLDLDLGRLGLPAGTRAAGNLPYNISSPILFRILGMQASEGLFADATFMLQKEVADRLAATPGTKDYGVLSIMVALECRVSRLLTLPPGAFRPAPAVTSAVVRLAFRPRVERLPIPPGFEALVKALFTRRRKMLRSALGAHLGGQSGLILGVAALDGHRRAETLSIEELLRLGAAVAEAGAASRGVPPK